MKNDAYTRAAGPARTTEPILGTVKNHDGGAVYEIPDLDRARRFLILGTAGGTYYQGEREITRENAAIIAALADTRPRELVALIVDVSERGLAAKVDPQLYALAVCTASPGESRVAAFEVFNRVVRTGSHLLMWARYHKALGGKVSRSWRRTVADWYYSRDVDALAYQLAKYRQRDGWSQKDLIDMSHALSGERPDTQQKVLRWARGENVMLTRAMPALIAQLEGEVRVPDAIRAGASWEMLPDEALTKPETWTMLLRENRLPLHAMLRNLARLTQLGVVDPYFQNEASNLIRSKFYDSEQLRRARLHPLSILMAVRQYGAGSRRSGGTFQPNMGIVETLDKAFYMAFETAPASNKRHLVGVDVSPSMNRPYGQEGLLKSNEIAAVLAMKIMATEPASLAVGFARQMVPLPFSRVTSLDAAMRATDTLSRQWGATNPGALMEHALDVGLEVDTFVIITDNEVNYGYHVPDLLRQYRRKTGINAKLVVLATTPTNFSIADPNDPGMLDIAGFGADVPALITQFSAD